MSLFKTPDWESSSISEKPYKETFKRSRNAHSKSKKQNEKLKSTQVIKKSIKKSKNSLNSPKNITKLNKKIKTIVQNLPNTKNTHCTKKLFENEDQITSTNIKNKLKSKGKKVALKQNKKQVITQTEKIKPIAALDVNEDDNKSESRQKLKLKKIKHKIEDSLKEDENNYPTKFNKKKSFKNSTLRERMIEKLKAARFRYLNEELYTKESREAEQVFNSDPDAFKAYHDGYRQQVQRWPLNPLDKIIAALKKMPRELVIADFGCGEAKLAASVLQKVHSFDLVALNPRVTTCNMAHCPLQNSSVDVVVFCLSLMGKNLQDFLLEANRVLKIGGTMKIAEVESRFDTVETFIKGVERFNFTNTWKDLSHQLFYFLDFKKQSNIKQKNKLPSVSLHPCMYKKR